MSLPKLGIASYELGISYVMTYDNLQPGAHQTKFPFAKFSGRDISMLLFGLLCSLSYYKMDQNYQLICHKVNKDTKISDKNDSKTKKLRHKNLRRNRLIHKQPGVGGTEKKYCRKAIYLEIGPFFVPFTIRRIH